MKDFDYYYDNLPIELKIKIMYKSGIIHPVAKIIKEFVDDISFLRLNRFDLYKLTIKPLSFYKYLCELNYLESYGIEIEELIYHILYHHFV